MKSPLHIAMILGAFTLGSTSALAQPAASGAAAPEYKAAVRPDVVFPDPAHAVRKQGAFIPPANIRLVAPGLDKKQVYTLLDVPHFHEALFGERKWDYILNFYTGNGIEHVSCQFEISFDRQAKVESAYWNSDTCLTYVAPAPPQPPVSAVSPVDIPRVFEPKLAETRYMVNFAFDSVELGPEAMATLEAAARQAGQGSKGITITGYTDTSGSDAYNNALSLRRAEAVAAALEKLGVDQSSYSLIAQGERDLAVQTEDGIEDMRNRRSQVIVSF